MSGLRGTIRKVYDISPTPITVNGNYDGSSNPSAPTTAWTAGLTPFLWLSGIPQSDDDNGRVGQSVAVETLDLRVKITPDVSVSGTSHLRMLVVADNEYDGSLSISEVLGDVNNATTSLDRGVVMQWNQPAYFGRFRIIEDKHWHWYQVSNAGNPSYIVDLQHGGSGMFHESHHDMKGHRLMWDTTDTNTTSSARKGHIFMIFMYENMSVATGGIPSTFNTTSDAPAIQYSVRLRYRDA